MLTARPKGFQMDLKKIDALLKEYDNKYEVFKKFTEFCRLTIENFLISKNCDAWKDSIKSRPKNPASLKKKLIDNPELNFSKISEIHDLAGIRVTFFLQHELQKFLSELLQADALKPLQVVDCYQAVRDPGFMGTYVILSLSKSNKDPLLAEFKGLLCELQLTDSFQNTWAEVFHRTIYKKQELSEFASAEMAILKKRYSELIEGNLREVSDAVHYLHQAATKLAEGAITLSPENIEEIARTRDLQQTWSLLYNIENHLRNFGPRLLDPEILLKHLSLLRERSKQLPFSLDVAENFRTPLRLEILKAIIRIFKFLHDVLPIPIYGQLYAFWKTEPSVKTDIAKLFIQKSEYDVHFITSYGYSHHLLLVTWLRDIVRQDDEITDLCLSIASSLLKLELTGTAWSSVNCISITQGLPPCNKQLINIRTTCFEIFFDLIGKSSNEAKQAQIIRLITAGLRLPSCRNTLPLEYKNMLLEESTYVVDKFQVLMRDLKLSGLLTMEHELSTLYYWYTQEGLSADSLEGLLKKEFHKAKYIQIRQLVGRNWEKTNGSEKTREILMSEARKLARTISSKNWNIWKKRILKIAELYPTLMGEFELFEEFLDELALSNSAYANELLVNHFNDLGWFVRVLITPLLNSSLSASITSFLIEKIKEGNQLHEVAQGLFKAKTPPVKLLLPLFKQAKQSKNLHLMNYLMYALSNPPKKWPQNMIKNLFIEGVTILAENNHFEWVKQLYSEDVPILKMLVLDEHLQVLDTLIKMPHIGFPIDPILSLVARRNPEKALNFFFERKDFKQQHQLANDYSIWPSQLVKLSNILHNTPYEHLIEFFSKFQKQPLDDKDYISRLIAFFFSTTSVAITELLDKQIEGNNKNINLSLSVLECFEGSPITYEWYRKIISANKLNRNQKNRICSYLLFIKNWKDIDGQLKQIEIIKESVMGWNSNDKTATENLGNFKSFFQQKADLRLHQEKTRVSRESYFQQAEFDDSLK